MTIRSSCILRTYTLAAIGLLVLPGVASAGTDGDGMPDAWETTHGFDPGDPSDALLDADADGLLNFEEYYFGTNPHLPDTDADLMPDYWESYWGLDPVDPSDATLDPDGDGLDNLAEYQADADPTLSDPDQDGLLDPDEVAGGTDPRDADTDNDGLSDSEEPGLGLDPLARDSDLDDEIDGLQHGTIIRVSHPDPAAPDGWGDSTGATLSADGRFAAFASEHSSLVVGDENQLTDVFWIDVQTGETRRVSVASDGSEANDWSGRIVNSIGIDISADGRLVAFQSAASNLVPGDTNNATDIFVHDVETGATVRVNLAHDGSQANGSSWYPSLASDGESVAFRSGATNLVAGGDGNGSTYDVFVRDLQTNTIERVSIDSAGIQGNGDSDFPAISGDGRSVVFLSKANNLVTGDTNGPAGDLYGTDVFVHDRSTGETRRVSVASDGTEHTGGLFYYPAISDDGRVVAFMSQATNLVPNDTNVRSDIFVHDLATATTERASVAADGSESNNHSNYPALSASGRYLVFQTTASNLVPGDTNGRRDLILRDLESGSVTRLNLRNDGSQGSLDIDRLPDISADGRFAQFSTSSAVMTPDAMGSEQNSFLVETGMAPDSAAAAVPALHPVATGLLVLSLLAAGGQAARRRSSPGGEAGTSRS